MEDFLSARHINYSYQTLDNEIQAIKDLTFSVKEKSFASIVGPSGCGKTTILSLIAGLLTPSSGEILIDGVKAGKNNNVGYMFQRDQLFEWRTVWQNVTLGLELQKKNKDQEKLFRAEELLKKYDLYNFKNKKPRTLSGGMRQRVALIRTLMLEPKLLLLDEPFSALDFQTRLVVCDDVYQIIKQEEKTALLVSHDISEALSMSDRIIVLSNRPATVKQIVDLNFSGSLPLEKREDSNFGKYFEFIWRNLTNDDQREEEKAKSS